MCVDLASTPLQENTKNRPETHRRRHRKPATPHWTSWVVSPYQKPEEIKQEKQQQNHHSSKELGEGQPPPVLPEGNQRTLQLKGREENKKHCREEGEEPPSSSKTVHTTRLSLFFLSQEDEERGKKMKWLLKLPFDQSYAQWWF